MQATRIAEAVETLNWLATQIHTMPDRGRDTVEAGVFLALSSVCLGDYVRLVAKGVEPYDALRTAADEMTEYRREVLQQWNPIGAPAATEDATLA
ncbi:hypothetical protein [Ramlibacter sp.]|uniref:hypothetical protein n=1 Tax=Ramlibacter sp. TaxID=1917967 RepID=UPI003D0B5BD8